MAKAKDDTKCSEVPDAAAIPAETKSDPSSKSAKAKSQATTSDESKTKATKSAQTKDDKSKASPADGKQQGGDSAAEGSQDAPATGEGDIAAAEAPCFRRAAADKLFNMLEEKYNEYEKGGEPITLSWALDRLIRLAYIGVVAFIVWAFLTDKVPHYGRTTASGDVPFRAARRMANHTNWVRAVAFRPDGARVASGGWDERVVVWDPCTGDVERRLAGFDAAVLGVEWSPDGRWLATVARDRRIRVWDAAAWELEFIVRGHDDEINGLSWHPAGAEFATASADGNVTLWSAFPDWKQRRTLVFNRTSAFAVAYRPDGGMLAVGNVLGQVELWRLDAEEDEPATLLDGHGKMVLSLGWHPTDATRLASASADGTARVWDLGAGGEVAATLRHDGWVHSVAWSPDGARLVTASWDGSVRVWSAGGAELAVLRGHPSWVAGWVADVAWRPDGRAIASAGGDKAVVLWEEEVAAAGEGQCAGGGKAREEKTSSPDDDDEL